MPQIVGVRVGFGGRYKAGLWTPVEVLLRGGRERWSGEIAVIAPDGDGVPCRYSGPADGACNAGESKSVELYAKFGRTESALTVELRRPGDHVAQAERVFQAGASDASMVFPRALRSMEGLIVVVGPETFAVEESFAGLRQLAGGRTAPVRLPDAAQLPSRWCGYEGVDLVVLSTTDPKAYAGLKPDGPRIRALEQWVRMGGAMLLCAGRNAEAVLGADAPLARFAPGKFARMITMSNSGAIEAYCGSSVQIPRKGRTHQLGLRAPQLAGVQGAVEAREGHLPLVVRRAFGFGSVIFAAFDLDAPPLSDWADRGLLLEKLLDVEEALPDVSRPSGAVLHYGFDDMAGQLRSALDQFSHVPLVPFWIVVGLVIGYLVLIGPGDYFLLRKIGGHMALTWITFPLVVLAFSLGAYLLAHHFKGDRARVNQVDLVDVDLASGESRGTSWATVFSPRAQRRRIRFQPVADRRMGLRPVLVGSESQPTGAVGSESQPTGAVGSESQPTVMTSWFGLPGEGFGGMDPKTATPTLWNEIYDCSPRLDALVGVPMPTWSTKSFVARWMARTSLRPEIRITERDRVPLGTITNTLGFPFSQCLLCYDRWVYRLGDLAPGESAQVGPVSERRDLNTFLTGRRLLFEEGGQRATPYDRGSVDLAYILRAMMFFKAAGGYRYTGLTHRHQGFVDMSDLLKTNHAILVATGPAADAQSPHPGARLISDGRPLGGPTDRHLTIYRFVAPVGKDER